MNLPLIESIATDTEAFRAVRRDLHAHPELGFEERRTSETIAKLLSDWGIPVHRGLGTTGVVGVISNGTSGRAVGLRADIDALPMTERNTFAHASTHPGRMHACGHDGHTTMLLAAAKHLAAHRDFDGTVYLIFQPAEEGGGGAREMIKDGLFERFPMEAVFGIHNWPGAAAGRFVVKAGPVFASSNEFKIVIRGRGTHAAMPNFGIDPVPVACQMVQAFQTIVSRNKEPLDPGVISVTMIQAGETTNVIAESCEIQGTVRTFSLKTLDMIEQAMRRVAAGTCQAFGADCEFQFHRNYPPTVNHAAETAFVRELLAEWAGDEAVLSFDGTMGAEDFGYFLQEKPGCYFLITGGTDDRGAGPCMLHSPNYDFNDELIPIGATMWVRLAGRWLNSPPQNR